MAKNSNGYIKSRSRKWKLVLLIVLLSTIGAFVPPLVSAWILGMKPLIIVSGTEWVSVITMVVASYIAGNVYQKKVENNEGKTKVAELKVEEPKIIISNNENGEA